MRTREGNKEKDILEAAIKVFAEHGYHKAKISKIAEIANVAAGSVYVYFKNKEDIILKIFERLWESLYYQLKELAENKSINPADKIDSMIDLVFDVFIENPSLAVVFVNEQNHLLLTNEANFTDYYEKFLDEGEKVLREGIKSKHFAESVELTIFRHYIFGALRNLLHNWAQDPNKIPLTKIRQNVKYLTKHGILKP